MNSETTVYGEAANGLLRVAAKVFNSSGQRETTSVINVACMIVHDRARFARKLSGTAEIPPQATQVA